MRQESEVPQNQHYVPKFILRQFLCDQNKEQVKVYDKHEDKTFTTSIKNIMAERQFNNFTNNDLDVSFEPVASKIEEVVLPVYREVLKTRSLSKKADQQATLAFFVAFQFLRTKAHRVIGDTLEEAVRKRVEAIDRRIEDVKGWEPRTEDIRKREHIRSIVNSIDPFTRIIAQKDFFLADAAAGEMFYLGDAPVTLTNRQTFGAYGNIGLGVPGIEIYMPLSADLMLCIWCPSILKKLSDEIDKARALAQEEALSRLMRGQITAVQIKDELSRAEALLETTEALKSCVSVGRPISSNSENMKHYNSLQEMYAFRHVVSKDGRFEIARQHNKEFPKFRFGNGPTVG